MTLRGSFISGLVTFGAITAPAAAQRAVEVSVDTKTTHQVVEGFGACFQHWTEPAFLRDPAYYDMMVNDLGMTILRIPVPESLEAVNDDDDPNHFNWDGFTLGAREALPTERGREPSDWGMDRRMRIAQEFKRAGVTRFLGSLWSPPEFCKTHRSQVQGGHLRMDRTDEFAEYWAAFVILAKRNYGIDIGAITVQNELLFTEFYDSCVYSPEQLREAVTAIGRKFQREGIKTRVLIPEDMMFPDRMFQYIAPTMNDAEAAGYVGGFATHRQQGFKEVRQWHQRTKQYGLQTWMTETSGHPMNWQGAMKMAADMHDYLVGGNMSAWTYWQLDGGGGLSDGGKKSPKYHAARHFYRFVRPGAVRVESASNDEGVLASAFTHAADGTLSIVLINNGDAADVTLKLAGDGLPREYKVVRSTESQGSAEQDVARAANLMISLPARSIVTLQGAADGLRTSNAKHAWPEPVQAPVDEQNPVGNFAQIDHGPGFDISRAAEMNNLEWLNRGISQGQVNAQRTNGWTALHMALLAGSGDAVERLLEAGADVNLAANDGWTPLHMAAAAFKPDHNNKQKRPPHTQQQILRMILAQKPDLTAVTTDGWNALHAAVANAHTGWQSDPGDKLNRIRDLIQAGVALEHKDQNGRTPLHWAAWQGYTSMLTHGSDVADVLIAAGANLNATDALGRTALHYAAHMGYEPIVRSLVKAGTDTGIKDNDGATALDLAQRRKLTKTVAALQGAGDAPAAGTARKARPLGRELFEAARSGDTKRVGELLDQGADTQYMDSDGFRAIDRARDHGHTEIVRMLEEAMKKE